MHLSPVIKAAYAARKYLTQKAHCVISWKKLYAHDFFFFSLRPEQIKFVRERRNFFSTTKGDNKCRADEIRIDGMRVESSDKPVSYSEDNVPQFISRTRATLRLFGCGFTDQTMITFTQDANNRNDACLIAAAGQFKVRSAELREYTAVVDIIVPNAELAHYYFCVRNADDNEKVNFKLHIVFPSLFNERLTRKRSKAPILTSFVRRVCEFVCSSFCSS